MSPTCIICTPTIEPALPSIRFETAVPVLRSGIEDRPWNARELQAIDPFGNRIRFTEYNGQDAWISANAISS